MHGKDRFDEMLIDIGSRIFDLQADLAGFIREIMHSFGSDSMEIDYRFPVRDGDEFRAVRGIRIVLDPDDMKLLIHTDEPGVVFLWHEIDLAAQEILANDLHMRYVARMIRRDLS